MKEDTQKLKPLKKELLKEREYLSKIEDICEDLKECDWSMQKDRCINALDTLIKERKEWLKRFHDKRIMVDG